MDGLRALAADRGITIIEDAAHAVGARYDGKPIGATGTACFSFYPNKNMTTGEGGMITTSDDELAERSHILRLHGLSRDAWERFRSKRIVFSDAVSLGFKYNLTDLQAAMGLVQLGRLDGFMEERVRLAGLYDVLLAGLPGIRPQPRPWTDEVRHGHHLYVVQVNADEFGLSRNDLLGALREENIGAGVHYRAVHLHPYYAKALQIPDGDLPRATATSSRVLSLPLSPAMTEYDVERVASALRRLHDYYTR
jgi:dTDP-4-amino-4,6-dideoxygalactose transaminase